MQRVTNYPSFEVLTFQVTSLLDDRKMRVVTFTSPQPFRGPLLRDILTTVGSMDCIKSTICQRMEGQFCLHVDFPRPVFLTKAVAEKVDALCAKYPGLNCILPELKELDARKELAEQVNELVKERTVRLLVPGQCSDDIDENGNLSKKFTMDGKSWRFVVIPPGGEWRSYFEEEDCPILYKDQCVRCSWDSNGIPIEVLLAKCAKYGACQQIGNGEGRNIVFKTVGGLQNALFHKGESPLKIVSVGGTNPLVSYWRDNTLVTIRRRLPHSLHGLIRHMQLCDTVRVTIPDMPDKNVVDLVKKGTYVLSKSGVIDIDFCGYYVDIDGITFQSGPFDVNGMHMRDFVIEGKFGDEFRVLAEVKDCECLNGPCRLAPYNLQAKYFQALRIRQTRNWSGTCELCLSTLEIFGTLVSHEWVTPLREAREQAQKKAEINALQDILYAERYKEMLLKLEKKRARAAIPMKKKTQLMQILYSQFCDCFELPLRKALPDMSEDDIEYTLDVMFARLPERLQPHVRYRPADRE